MRFNDRVAVVTGAASGIGAATARAFAAEGAHVVAVDINGEGARAMAEELDEAGHSAEAIERDVSDQAGTRQDMAGVFERHGHIDALVNCAVAFTAKGLDATTEDWEHSLSVNIGGYSNMVQACHEGMKASSTAAIVNLASISGHIAQPNRWTYHASKGGILAMTTAMALDLSADGIRVNCISPGWIWTPEVAKAAEGDREKWEPVWGPYHMLRRFGEASEVADACMFLCSGQASFITATELRVDGGYLGMGAEGLGEDSKFAGSA
jgi:NAD(P)-dependent dehydrogenase (short-subunit alcohol dehydrogenase family)